MHWLSDSLLTSIPLAQSERNYSGRQRCREGVLSAGPQTRPILPADYPHLDLLVVENFLSKQECSVLLKAFDAMRASLNAHHLNNDYWQGRLLFAHDVAARFPDAGLIMQRFQREAARRIGEFYRLTAPVYADTVQLVLWQDGIHMPPHADNANPDGSPHGMAWRNFSSIVYLNDDYDGGELYFTALDRTLKPKAGMLVAFTGGFHHEHGVLKVRGKDRYTMPGFYTFDRSKADRFIYPELGTQS